MNETTKSTRVVDHVRTEKILKEIMNAVKRQGNAYLTYQQKMDNSQDQAMYSAQYLKGIADKYLELLVEVGKDNFEKFSTLIEEAKKVEEANDKVLYDVTDQAMQAALNTINILGNDMDYQTRHDIIISFRGQKRTLDVIKKIMDVKGIVVADDCKKFVYNSEELFGDLYEALSKMALEPKNLCHYGEVVERVKSVAITLGIELSDADLEVGVPMEQIRDARMRVAMGI